MKPRLNSIPGGEAASLTKFDPITPGDLPMIRDRNLIYLLDMVLGP